ncbi:hypothetical protein [Prosthecobacter sp.]|uniref:hypothetical protein n=1 Tax=Prosthecobacter sp. TaxID=1965333 RepID=UPI003BB1E895
MQRLREIRQSNIDSLDLPGFANTTRYEHALGTAYLASAVEGAGWLDVSEKMTLEAAALLHDSAISSYGHLLEEAFGYSGIPSDHEQRWSWLLSGTDSTLIGGVRSQIYLGRQAALDSWIAKWGSSKIAAHSIFETIRGRGKLGPLVCGSLDLDNLDNVTRAAFHVGLCPDRNLPLRIAKNIVGLANSHPIYLPATLIDIQAWLDLRKSLYNKLMFAQQDFTGKAMLISAAVSALESGLLKPSHWILTDREFISLLLSGSQDIASPVKDWLSGDLWPFSGILTLKGNAPTLTELFEIGKQVSETLKRECFAYRIKDKRTRAIVVNTSDGHTHMMGKESNLWFFGVVSRKKSPFKKRELTVLRQLIEKLVPQSATTSDFGCPEIGSFQDPHLI